MPPAPDQNLSEQATGDRHGSLAADRRHPVAWVPNTGAIRLRPDRLSWLVLHDLADRAEVERALAGLPRGASRLVLLWASPDDEGLPPLVTELRSRDREPMLVTETRPERSEGLALRAAGLHELCLLGDVPPWLEDVPQRTSIGALIDDEPHKRLALATRHGLTLRLFRQLGPPPRVPRDPLTPEQAETLDTLARAARRAKVLVVPDDLGHTPPPGHRGEPIHAEASLLEWVGRGAIPSACTAGLLSQDPGLLAEGPTLAAAGTPLMNVVRCWGGVPDEHGDRVDACSGCRSSCPGPVRADAVVRRAPAWRGSGRTAVVILPHVHDELMVLSTLPALADALQQEGVETRLESAWDLTWDPQNLQPGRGIAWWERLGWLAWRTLTRRHTPVDHYEPPDHKLGHPLWWDEPEERAVRVEDAFFAALDLTDVELVVVPGFRAARRVLALQTLSPRARVVIADFHMLAGAAELAHDRNPAGRRLADGAWWPGERVIVHSCFPRYARLYRSLGIPLQQVHWRPYPLYLRHFRSGTDPTSAEVAFSGGRHFRDYDTLERAAMGLRDTTPIEIFADEGACPAAIGPLRPRGTAPLTDFVARLSSSRFVVMPMHHDVDTASGLTVLAMAHASGRPVLTTLAPCTLDHVRHDVDGLVVPPHDATALAAALKRLEDEATLERLTLGARAAGSRASVATWARELARGPDPDWPRFIGGSWAPW